MAPASSAPSQWNALRYQPGQEGHVESYFLKLNDPAGRRALWLKATILARFGAAPVAEVWAIAFDREARHVAVKQVVPYAEASFSRDGFDVGVANVRLRDGHVEGRIDRRDERVEWSLDFSTDTPPLVPFFSQRMYEGKLPSSKFVSPHPDSRFDGWYRVGGSEVRVEGWKGMQGHNWGKGHAELYGWGHCNQWDDADDLLLEGVTARVRLGPMLTPPLTVLAVWHRGVRYEFNRPREIWRADAEVTPRRWTFSAQSQLARVEGELKADTRDFVGLYYENPNGQLTYCLNSKIAEARLCLAVYGRPTLIAHSRAAALEIGTKDESHGVSMLA